MDYGFFAIIIISYFLIFSVLLSSGFDFGLCNRKILPKCVGTDKILLQKIVFLTNVYGLKGYGNKIVKFRIFWA